MSEQEIHPIQVVARRTGVSPHLIRMWERRYAAVVPSRNPTNRRRYSEADIERLRWLRRATLTGWRIGQIAHLPTEQIARIVAEDEPLQAGTGDEAGGRGRTERILCSCLAAVQGLDAESLEESLRQARLDLGVRQVLDRVISPLFDRIGMMWTERALRPMHEHLATGVVHRFLAGLERSFPVTPRAPQLVVGTPVGQLHEIGAMLVATTATTEGWRVTYLGADLPADEIASAAATRGARAVALSIVYPCTDAGLVDELRSLKEQLGEAITLLVGGRGCEASREAIERAGAIMLRDLADLRRYLSGLVR